MGNPADSQAQEMLGRMQQSKSGRMLFHCTAGSHSCLGIKITPTQFAKEEARTGQGRSQVPGLLRCRPAHGSPHSLLSCLWVITPSATRAAGSTRQLWHLKSILKVTLRPSPCQFVESLTSPDWHTLTYSLAFKWCVYSNSDSHESGISFCFSSR